MSSLCRSQVSGAAQCAPCLRAMSIVIPMGKPLGIYNTDLPATAASHLPSGVGVGEQSVSISSIRRRAVCTSPERTKNSQHLQPSRAPSHAHCMWVAMSGVKRITPASCHALSTGNYKPQGQRSALYLSVSGSSKIVRLHCNV